MHAGIVSSLVLVLKELWYQQSGATERRHSSFWISGQALTQPCCTVSLMGLRASFTYMIFVISRFPLVFNTMTSLPLPNSRLSRVLCHWRTASLVVGRILKINQPYFCFASRRRGERFFCLLSELGLPHPAQQELTTPIKSRHLVYKTVIVCCFFFLSCCSGTESTSW